MCVYVWVGKSIYFLTQLRIHTYIHTHLYIYINIYVCVYVCVLSFFQFIVYRKLNRILCVHARPLRPIKKNTIFPDLIKHKYKAITHDDNTPFSFSTMFYISNAYIHELFFSVIIFFFLLLLFAHFLSTSMTEIINRTRYIYI